MPKGRGLIAYLMLVAVALLVVAGGLTSDTLLGVAVIVLGAGGILMAVSGKPERVWGLTERLLHLLPDPVWRAVMATMGVAIIALGVLGLIFG